MNNFLSMISNPYHNQSFFNFLQIFFSRLFQFLFGQLSIDQLASDEVQALVLMGVAFSSALVGTFLVLRRMTMLANALSHTILIGIVLAFVFSSSSLEEGSFSLPIHAMLIASFGTGIVTTFLTEFLTKTGKLQEDASTGLVFTSLFALGIILVTVLTKSAHIGTEAVMGNADALHRDDLVWVYLTVGVNLMIIFLLFKEFKMTTFDSALAKAMGFSPLFFNYLLMTQTSMTTMTSFRAVGVLLVLSFMTGPVLAAKLLTHHLNRLLILSSIFGILCALVGVALTRHLLTVYGVALSTSGMVVCVITLLYVTIASVCEFKKKYNSFFLVSKN